MKHVFDLNSLFFSRMLPLAEAEMTPRSGVRIVRMRSASPTLIWRRISPVVAIGISILLRQLPSFIVEIIKNTAGLHEPCPICGGVFHSGRLPSCF